MTTAEARNSAHYARTGQVPFDERSYKQADLAVESFGRNGKVGSKSVNQLAASVVEGEDNKNLWGKDS